MAKNKGENIKINSLSKYPDMLTVEHLCELLHVGRKSIYGMMKRGELRYAKIGKSYISSKYWLKECMEKRSNNDLNIIAGYGRINSVPKDEPAERSLLIRNGR